MSLKCVLMTKLLAAPDWPPSSTSTNCTTSHEPFNHPTHASAPPNNGRKHPPTNDSTRGVPYYEKLKRDLRDTLQKKALLDKNLAALEDQIYRHETAYLEDTSAGNIIRGFDNYIKSSSTSASLPSSSAAANTSAGTASRRKSHVVEQDRVFSRSSTAFAREVSPGSSPQVESQGVTPTSFGEGGTPTGGGGGGVARKGDKKRKKGVEEEEEGEKKGPQRIKFNFSGNKPGKAVD
ncbi:hypothetical protein G7Y79_00017g044060 [Physcia stellaris]|nr:hypothetical protein G7Y79_00017g044060 [Physcia stellaris]